MTQSLATNTAADRALLAASDARRFEDVKILDVWSGGVADEPTRLDAIATISAGWKGERGLPQVSRDRTIKLHDPNGRAPGLKAALEATEYRRLLVTFPFDEPSGFIFQRFAEYSASKCITSGDELALVVKAPDGTRTRLEAGSPEYLASLARCKRETWVYFHLAEIDQDGAFVIFPDGGLPYRHRFTSSNSLRNLRASLNYIRRFTGGRLAGIPFDLCIDNRDVTDGKGDRHNAPVWTWTAKLTEGVRLDSRQFSKLVRVALAQGEALRMLPAPSAEAMEYAALGESDVDEPTDGEMQILESAGLCDYEHWIKTWHALARDTAWEADDARAAFVGGFSGGQCDSLADFLRTASEERAAALTVALAQAIARTQQDDRAAMHDRIFGSDADGTAFADMPRATTPGRPDASSQAHSATTHAHTSQHTQSSVEASAGSQTRPVQSPPLSEQGARPPEGDTAPSVPAGPQADSEGLPAAPAGDEVSSAQGVASEAPVYQCSTCQQPILAQGGEPINASQADTIKDRFGKLVCRECRPKAAKKADATPKNQAAF